MPAPEDAPVRRVSTGGLVALNLAGLVVVAALAGLGTWQVQRLAWKRDLIERVETRIHAAPAPAPDTVTAEADAYRRVAATGVLLHDRATLVQAVTALGGGFWVLTPLRAGDGRTILVNRGFVPSDRRDPAAWAPASEPVTIAGLIRMSEPGGAFLRSNDPAANRWYSRDVAAIAAARGLPEVAPYFIDAEAAPSPGGLPVGGLTVVDFPNNHLVYAITWFVLAAMTLAALALADLQALRARSAPPARSRSV